jgi:L-ascorbate metabolism protein UlaG (beta-lactamase superfamily)
MKVTQIRNATIVIEAQNQKILVDPMLAKQSSLPKLRYFKSHRRNPLVELPNAFGLLESNIDYAMITHCQKGHFDHLDRAGVRWLRENNVTTFCTEHDQPYLNKKGIRTKALPKKSSSFLDGHIDLVPATHTTGWLTPFMEHGTGYFINLANEPSLYLMGDTVLTDTIREFVINNQPDYIVAPTGKAQFDIGAPLLLNEMEIIELAELSSGSIIANHMDALDHCRIGRLDLIELLNRHNLEQHFLIPKDGETLELNI